MSGFAMNRFNATTAEWVVAAVEPTEIFRKLEHRGEIRLVACDRIFHEMGGFADIPIMEDIEFSRRLHSMGRIALLDPPLWSSPEALPQFGQPRIPCSTPCSLCFSILA